MIIALTTLSASERPNMILNLFCMGKCGGMITGEAAWGGFPQKSGAHLNYGHHRKQTCCFPRHPGATGFAAPGLVQEFSQLLLPALDILPLDLWIIFAVNIDAVFEVVRTVARVGSNRFLMAIDPDFDPAAVGVMNTIDAGVNAIDPGRTYGPGLEHLEFASIRAVDAQLVD